MYPNIMSQNFGIFFSSLWKLSIKSILRDMKSAVFTMFGKHIAKNHSLMEGSSYAHDERMDGRMKMQSLTLKIN